MTDIDEKLRQIKYIVFDFDGVLSDGRVWFDGEGRPFRWIHARDATGITLWHLAGGKSALVSGLGCAAMEVITERWKCCECHMWIKDKARVCRDIAERNGISLDEMAFLGDDIIDLYAIRAVGLGVAVADAEPGVKQEAALVLESSGGTGAIRELVTRILRAQGRLDDALEEYCGRKDGPQ